MRSALLALLSLFAPGLSSADDSLSPKVLDRVKQATVFIHVEAGARSGTGSAFLIQTEDGSELIVTNEHVVNPKAILERIVRPPAITRRVRPPVAPNHGRPVIPTPGRPVVPAPGRPRNQPGLPPDFQIPNQQPPLTLTYQPPAQVVTSLVTAKKVSVKVVFFSGTKREKTVRAELVGTDDLKDLALIKVEKFAESPAPLEMGGESELIETMPVYIFGFPFGELLSGNKGNPSATIGRGSITRLPRNAQDEITHVQFDGNLNPGNSGGPVVDTKGRLIGVAKSHLLLDGNNTGINRTHKARSSDRPYAFLQVRDESNDSKRAVP